MARLKLRTDGHALVPQRAPEVLYDKSIRERFGVEDNILVLIGASGPEGVFNPRTVQLVRDLTAALKRMPGIKPGQVMSLATEPSFRFHPGTWSAQTLLEPPLKTQAELDQLREDLRRIQLYTGTLVSLSGQSTLILVGTPPGTDRGRLYAQVADTIAARPPGPEQVHVTGAPVAESLLGIHILEDLGVPGSVLGASSRLRSERPPWKLPGSLYEVRLLLARRIGLVPVAVLVMMLVFLLTFRNVLAMLVPLPGVLATLLIVFGLMGWLGVPIYLSTAVMPILLTATGVTNDIYLFSRYFALLGGQQGRPSLEVLGETFDKMAAPVACTSLTAAVGFLSFGFAPLMPVRAFGLCTAFGVVFGLLYSFTALPALLAIIDPKWLLSGARAKSGAASLGEWFARFAPVVARWRWPVAGSVLLIAALTPLGLRHLVVQDSWIDGFDPNSEFRRVALQVNEQFYGMHLLLVSFEAPEVLVGEAASSALSGGTLALPGDWLQSPALVKGSPITLSVLDKGEPGAPANPDRTATWRSQVDMPGRIGDRMMLRLHTGKMSSNFWRELSRTGRMKFEIVACSHVRPEIIHRTEELASFIRQRSRYAVGGVLSPFDYITTTRFMIQPDDPNARRLPSDPDEISMLWDFYRIARGERRLREVVDTNYWQSLTTVFLKDGNFRDTAKLMSEIRAYEREQLAPKGIKLGFAGDVAVSQSLIQGIVTTQLQSLLWSLAGVFAVTAFFGGSLRWGVYCLLPSLLAVVIKFAAMGWLGVGLGVATSMFAAMTLGIGVNCAIHLLESYRQAWARGAPTTEALTEAMALTGPPALINTIAISLGFGVLMLSQVPANARLGLLLVLGLVNCFLVSLLLLPVLLHWWPLKDAIKAGPPPDADSGSGPR